MRATTRLSSKGQVIIPRQVRAAHHWEIGQELEVIDTGDGVLLKPKKPFPETTLAEVVGSLGYRGKARTMEDMEEAIRRGARESGHDRR
ncbi:AbrB/MazE/SpoVT family DNA-binding domain-containing protein [Geoalkalibacter sp.]|uniref:AbrB/MazE/SpoVT family DNA-binding domain-containing protein n=1 Tax=Geoalkalibacter sp. TaxID=3041440 RepID=UPI00272EDBDB|nr:AbrB/MazE/SpoVT family DNA-binding domain-containing protein [Geoalkalibacter sp.]